MSVRQDEPMKFKAAIFEWYAMGYRYPILKIIEASIKKGERKVLDQSFAYAANVEGMSHLEDEQNKELKDKMRGISLESNTKQGDISYKVSVNGKKVCLSYSLVSDAQLRFLICNTSAWYLSLLPCNSRQVTTIAKISIAQGCLWESMYFTSM